MKKYFYTISLIVLGEIAISQEINWKPYFTLDPTEGLSFTIDSTAVLPDCSVPGINIANDGTIILGFNQPNPKRGASISTDNGETFKKTTSFTTPNDIDGGFIYLPNGKTRYVSEFITKEDSKLQLRRSVIKSFISSDGKNWTAETGIRYQPSIADDSTASVPAILQVKDSTWRMYYVGDFYGSNGVRTAISNDWGVTWAAESSGNILPDNAVDPHPVYLSNGKIRIYCKVPYTTPGGGIGYIDGDGLTFSGSITVLFNDGAGNTKGKLDPFIIKYPNGKIACYFGTQYLNKNTSKIVAAWSSTVTGIESKNTSSLINIFPNPTTETIKLKANSLENDTYKIILLNTLGQNLQTIETDVSNNLLEVEVDLKNFPNGIYYLNVSSKASTISYKVQKL